MRTTGFSILFLALAWHFHAQAQTPRKCVACDTPLTGTFYWVSTMAVAEKQPVCEACSQLESVCAHCRLPLRKNFHTLDDGRLLCARDYAAAVFEPREALRIFDEARRDAQRLLDGYGVLPDRNVTVSLASSNTLAQMRTKLPSWHDAGTLLGLTRTHQHPGGRYTHSIFLLEGLSAARLTSISAHEYTHAWLHENVPAERKLDANAVEGFCELIAYKIAVDQREES